MSRDTKPSAADTVLSTPPPKSLACPRWPFSWDFRGGAKLFTLDNEASEYLHYFVTDNKDWLKDHIEFALLPYPKMIVQSDEGDGMWTVGVIRDKFDTPNFVSYSYTEDDGNINYIATDIHPDELPTDEHRVACSMLWARMLAFVLLLNGKRVHTIADSPMRKTLHRGRPVRYFANSLVRIDLTTPAQLRRAIATGTHATPRRHQVMGHFVHRGGQRDCAHPWQAVTRDPDDDIPRWECPDCGRKRTWRKAFERGDAGKGFVHQKYEVTA